MAIRAQPLCGTCILNCCDWAEDNCHKMLSSFRMIFLAMAITCDLAVSQVITSAAIFGLNVTGDVSAVFKQPDHFLHHLIASESTIAANG